MSILAIGIVVNYVETGGGHNSANYILNPAVCPIIDDPCVGVTGRIGPSTIVATALQWTLLNELVAAAIPSRLFTSVIDGGDSVQVLTTQPAFPNGITTNTQAVNGKGEILNWPTSSAAATTAASPVTLNPNFPDDGQLHFQNWDDRNRAHNAGALHGEHGFPKLTGIGTYQADYDRAYNDAYRTWYPIFNHGPRARTM